MSAERVRQLGRVAGILRSDHKEQQRIIPDITFTCSGTVTRWIVAANWQSDEDFPEVQIWRETATGSGVYAKVHGMTLPVGGKNGSQIYEYNTAPVDVQPGDILGMFEPNGSWLKLYYTSKYGPVNYYIGTTVPSVDFDIAGADGSTNDMPLVTVEISKLSYSCTLIVLCVILTGLYICHS